MDAELRHEAKILSTVRVIAVVGCSRNEGKPSYDIPAYMQREGFRIIPVNPNAESILGEKCYKRLSDIPFKVDIVDVFRPSSEALAITKEAFEAGVMKVWLQLGIYSEEAAAYAASKSMEIVMNRCIMVEYNKIKDDISTRS